MSDFKELKQLCVKVLRNHQGENNGITMINLFHAITGEVIIPMRANNQARVVRELIAQLQRDGHPICHSNRGYFMGTTAQVKKEAAWHRARGIASLMRSKYLLQQTNDQLLAQLAIDFKTEETIDE